MWNPLVTREIRLVTRGVRLVTRVVTPSWSVHCPLNSVDGRSRSSRLQSRLLTWQTTDIPERQFEAYIFVIFVHSIIICYFDFLAFSSSKFRCSFSLNSSHILVFVNEISCWYTVILYTLWKWKDTLFDSYSSKTVFDWTVIRSDIVSLFKILRAILYNLYIYLSVIGVVYLDFVIFLCLSVGVAYLILLSVPPVCILQYT